MPHAWPRRLGLESNPARRASARRRRAHAVVCALLLWGAGRAGSEPFYDADAGARYDSNLTRAQDAPDVRADGAGTLAASAGHFFAPTGSDTCSVALDTRAAAYHRFRGLDSIGAGASATYRHKFGLGRDAPWLALAGSTAYDGYRQELRTGARWELRAELGQRFAERFDAAVGGVLERRYQRHDAPLLPRISGKVFDLRGERAYVRAGYAATDALFLDAKLSVRRGDVESTTRPNPELFEAASALAADPTFGSDFFAYRLRGTTGTVALAGSWALDSRSSLNLVYAAERTRAYEDVGYRSYEVAVSYAYRY